MKIETFNELVLIVSEPVTMTGQASHRDGAKPQFPRVNVLTGIRNKPLQVVSHLETVQDSINSK